MPVTRKARPIAAAAAVLAALTLVGSARGVDEPPLWAPVPTETGLDWHAVRRDTWPEPAFERSSRGIEIALDDVGAGQLVDLSLLLPEGGAAQARWAAAGVEPSTGTLALVAGSAAHAELVAIGGAVRILVTASAPVVGAATAGSDDGWRRLAVGTLPIEQPWAWPLADDDASRVGQAFAEHNIWGDGRYHAGLDVGAEWGTRVRAMAAGEVVKIQRSVGWEDHGLGNAVIVRHRDSYAPYSLYAHLDSVDAALLRACGPVDAKKQGRHTCARPVAVAQGQTLGNVGSSGKGSSTYWGDRPHLHVEVRTFATLGPSGDDNSGAEMGYSDVQPETLRTGGAHWVDPLERLHSMRGLLAPLRLRSLRDAYLRVGPGGRGGSTFRAIGRVAGDVQVDADALAAGTDTPYCAGGWYRVRKVDGAPWPDATYSPGTLGRAWVCKDYLQEGSAPTPNPTPTPRPTPSPTPSPRPSPTPTPGPTPTPPADPALFIDGGRSSTRPQGQAFMFSASGLTPGRGVTRYLRQLNGSQVELTPKLSADGAGRLAWSYTAVCSTPLGTYSVWLRDDQSGRTSNSVSETLAHGAGCP